jgi:hypothetical protein
MINDINVLLPNQIINLSDISCLRFYNISYREYLAIYDEWIIGVYPWAVSVTSIWKDDGTLVDLEYIKIFSRKSSVLHHNDFLRGKCDYDPCVIFEDVSGVKIHQGESDDHLMYLDHLDDIRRFDSYLRGWFRNRRLISIGIL